MIRRRDDGTIDREHWGLVPTAFDLADAYDELVREIATLRRELDVVRQMNQHLELLLSEATALPPEGAAAALCNDQSQKEGER